MGTRRDFVRQGGWAVAGVWFPASAQERAAVEAKGTLSQPVVRTLMASAETVTGTAPLRGHYAAYWQHGASLRPGRRELYQRFAESVAASASAAGVADFAAADVQARAAVLEGLRRLPDFEREFEVAVFQEIFAVFQRTDAWLKLGYESWPGSPRGLADYRRPPGNTAPR